MKTLKIGHWTITQTGQITLRGLRAGNIRIEHATSGLSAEFPSIKQAITFAHTYDRPVRTDRIVSRAYATWTDGRTLRNRKPGKSPRTQHTNHRRGQCAACTRTHTATA